MSATPHNGKEADFQLFMGLLDADRFEGRFREGVHKADVVRHDAPADQGGAATASTARRSSRSGAPTPSSYELSRPRPTSTRRSPTYVREEMNRADRWPSDDKRRNNVGFALQILQRRLASSPAAIHQSLERRREAAGGAAARGAAAAAAAAERRARAPTPDAADRRSRRPRRGARATRSRRPRSRSSIRRPPRRRSPSSKPRSSRCRTSKRRRCALQPLRHRTPSGASSSRSSTSR